MIKAGVYCSKNKKQVKEIHGGGILKNSFYDHLCFYFPETIVGFYGGAKKWFSPYIKKSFRYSGHITFFNDNKIQFIINDPDTEDKINFQGQASGNLLSIKATRQSEPTIIWLEDVFEYIGTGDNV